MNAKILAAAVLISLVAPAAYPVKRRAVRPPELAWFHASIFVDVSEPPAQKTSISMGWPLREVLEGSTPYTLTLTTRAGQVTLEDSAWFPDLCTKPPCGMLFLFLKNSDGSFGDPVTKISPDVLPGLLEYRWSISRPSRARGTISFQIWADDNHHWQFVGGPVASVQKNADGGVTVYGVFPSDPMIGSSSAHIDVRDYPAALPSTGGSVEVPAALVGQLPTILSVCSAVSALTPNSLQCSIVSVE